MFPSLLISLPQEDTLRKLSVITCIIVAGMALTATVARAVQGGSDISQADAKQLYNYTLTMDKIQKTAAATKTLQELGKQHPELEKAGDAKSIDGTVQLIQRYPEAVAAITQAGLAPREYVMCLLTTMQAAMAVGFKKSGTVKEYPPKLLEQVSKANLDFVEQHWDEIQKMTASASSEDQ